MWASTTIAFALLFILGLVGWVVVGLLGWLDFPVTVLGPNRGLPAFVAPLPGLLLGLGLGALAPALVKTLAQRLKPNSKPSRPDAADGADDASLSPVSMAVIFAATATLVLTVLAGVHSRDLPVSTAVLALVCGAVTMLVAFYALEAIRRGEGLSVESHWGGLGGGLGGWRASTAAVLVFLLLVMLSVTAALSLMTPEVVLALARKAESSAAAGANKTDAQPSGSAAASEAATDKSGASPSPPGATATGKATRGK